MWPVAESTLGSGPGRILVAVYAVLALAATGRSIMQIALSFERAPVAYLLSALAAAIYIVATVALARGSRTSAKVAWCRSRPSSSVCSPSARSRMPCPRPSRTRPSGPTSVRIRLRAARAPGPRPVVAAPPAGTASPGGSRTSPRHRDGHGVAIDGSCNHPPRLPCAARARRAPGVGPRWSRGWTWGLLILRRQGDRFPGTVGAGGSTPRCPAAGRARHPGDATEGKGVVMGLLVGGRSVPLGCSCDCDAPQDASVHGAVSPGSSSSRKRGWCARPPGGAHVVGIRREGVDGAAPPRGVLVAADPPATRSLLRVPSRRVRCGSASGCAPTAGRWVPPREPTAAYTVVLDPHQGGTLRVAPVRAPVIVNSTTCRPWMLAASVVPEASMASTWCTQSVGLGT